VLVEGFSVNENMILRPKGGEPIMLSNARSGNKPHRAQEAYIVGGTTVYTVQVFKSKVDDLNERTRLAAGLTENEKRRYIRKHPKAKSWNWNRMTRDPVLYVRGRIRHPDHKTLILRDWHRVAVNGEIRGSNVVFLD